MSQILDLKCSNKHASLQNVSVYYMWKNVRQQQKNNKTKSIWNDEFELHDGPYSASGIQNYIKHIIIKQKRNITH